MTDKPRVETGPVMFEDDWPGIFIRGDDAFGYALAVEYAAVVLKDGDMHRHILKGLAQTLRSCHLPIADQSKLQKIWRGDPPQEPPESSGPSDEIARQEPKE